MLSAGKTSSQSPSPSRGPSTLALACAASSHPAWDPQPCALTSMGHRWASSLSVESMKGSRPLHGTWGKA